MHRPVARIVVWALTAMVVVPASLCFAYLLTWFLPEATGYTCDADEVACRRDPLDGVAWWLLLAAIVGGVVSLAVAWWRWWYVGRWWPWPVTALAFVAVGASLASVLG